MKLISRKSWGARSARAAASYLGSTRGVKVHYTGGAENTRMEHDHSLCAGRVRGIQNGHMDGNGWNDVGYSALVCPHGDVFVGRGLHALPAANGEGLNSGHYAVCGLVGNKGLTQPTPAMLNGIRDAIEWLRKEGGAGNEIKGHRDGYATDCPGGPLYAWVRKGAPRPNQTTTAEENDMPDYVSAGVKGPLKIPTGKWTHINWAAEYADTTHQHADEGGWSMLNGPAFYSVSVGLVVRGLPAGTLVKLRAVEAHRTDESKVDGGPVQDYVMHDGDNSITYAVPADIISKDYRLRLQMQHNGEADAEVAAGGAKVLFWRR